MLKENTLWGAENKVAIAVERIKEFAPLAVQNNSAGYYVCISGGKDSSAIQELCVMAGVKCEFVHNHTSVDHPETVRFVRREKERVERLGYAFTVATRRYRDGRQKTMWNGIVINGLPLKSQRWCCKQLKEFGGDDRYVITGVRWAESPRRKNSRNMHEITGKNNQEHITFNNDNDMKRKLTEMCLQKRRFVLNPIIDWTDDDVWDFLNGRGVPVNPLYAQGWKRVGCLGCPLTRKGPRELERFPKYKAMYFRAARRHIEHRRAAGLPEKAIMETPEKYFAWWLTGQAGEIASPLFEE
jgi:phosphoadenosine phosphosulfate reductase